MYLSFAFLVAVVVLFTANCEESGNDCGKSNSDAIEAATVAMKNCNSNIKNCFEVHKEKAVEKLYCKGMMVRFFTYDLCRRLFHLFPLFNFVPIRGAFFSHHLLTPPPLYIS